MLNFNPRTREGCDEQGNLAVHAILISIHAPVKGATGGSGRSPWRRQISIHAPVKGATAGYDVVYTIPGISIHAPVKGATLCLHEVPHGEGEFQSTHP